MKLLLVALLVAAVVLIIYSKNCCRPSTSGTMSPAELAATQFEPDTVLATVHGEAVTLEQLEGQLKNLSAQYRTMFERQKHEFLDELITRKLLVNEARRQRVSQTPEYDTAMAEHAAHPGHEEHVLVDVLLRTQVFRTVQVSDDDLRAFYEEHKAQLPGNPSFEEAKEMLAPSVRQQKQYEAVMEYLESLRASAAITRNEAWVEAQKKLAADNPLDEALSSGKPVLADFGQSTCIPCKMMKPILDELSVELKDRVHVLILDTRDYGHLARKHRIRIIPTQIFFDAWANEVFRHEGFMSKDDILVKLRELEILQE